MTLRRRTPVVLVVLAFAIAACSSNGEPSWSLTSGTSAGGLDGPQVEDLTGTMASWEFEEDVDS